MQKKISKKYKPFVLSTAIIAFLSTGNLKAQGSFSSSKYEDTLSGTIKTTGIEMVKIKKFTPRDKNKDKVKATTTDHLNHDAGAFLTSVPEINGIRKSGSYGTDPVLRGFKYEQLNLVIDGIATAVNACPSRMDPASSQVNMNMVKEAEIFKGPYNFRYGNAFGGTINFVSVSPDFTDKTKVSGRISTGYETNGNVMRNEFLGTLSAPKIVWDVFGSYQKADRYKDGNGNEVRSAFTRYNFGTKGNVKWNDKNTTTLQINTNQGRNVEFAALTMDLIYDKTWMYQIKHHTKFENSWLQDLHINTFFSNVKHSMGTPDLSMVSDVSSESYGARAELKFKKGKNIFFTGLDYKSDGAHNTAMTMSHHMPMRDGTSWQDSQIQQTGLFGEYQYQLPNAKITASLRLDYNVADAKDPSHLFQTLYGDLKSEQLNHSVSVGYTQKLNPNSQLSLWAGRAQRSGSLTERFINLFVVGNDAYEILGNPHVKPEINNQTDLIYTFQSDNFYFQADGFYSYLQDYISGVINPDIKPYSMKSPGVRQIQNISKAFKTGAEANFVWKFLPHFKTEMAVAYTYAEDLSTHNPLPEIAPLDYRWKIEADFHPVTVSLNYRHAGAQNRISTDFGELSTPSFDLFDLNISYQVFKNAFLIGNVYNIFDKAYAEHLSRAYSTDKNQRILSPGRNFALSFSYSF